MNIDKYKIKPINSIYTLYKIPFSEIERVNVSLKNKDKTWSLKKYCDAEKWDIGINACMFDMKTYQNVTDLIVQGIINNGGNYSNKGIAFGNVFPMVGAYKSTTSNSKTKPVDFIGGAPTLIIDGVISMDSKGLSASYMSPNTLTQRTALGINSAYLFIISTKANKSNLQSVAKELLAQGCTQAINLDGGGSTAIKTESSYYTQNRNIPIAFGVKLKPEVITTPPSTHATKIYKVAIDSGHNKLTAGKRSFDSSLLEYEFNMNVSERIKKHLDRHKVIESKIFQVENANVGIELSERCKQINTYASDICVSIHANAFGSTWNTANGWEIFSYKLTGKSQELAKAIKSTSIPYLNLTDRGIKDGQNLGMVSQTNMPTVLIEHGFYTNKIECEKLKSEEFREKCAIADAKGILKYFGIAWIEPTL